MDELRVVDFDDLKGVESLRMYVMSIPAEYLDPASGLQVEDALQFNPPQGRFYWMACPDLSKVVGEITAGANRIITLFWDGPSTGTVLERYKGYTQSWYVIPTGILDPEADRRRRAYPPKVTVTQRRKKQKKT